MQVPTVICLAFAILEVAYGAPKISPKIIGGQEAKPHQFPFQVALNTDIGVFCAGAILREDAILTAAHCCYGAEKIEVVAGAHDVADQEPTQQRIKSSRIVKHEEYDPARGLFDICLVFLSDNINFDGSKAPVELYDGDVDLAGETGTLPGWGRIGDKDTQVPPLQYVEESILSNEDCIRFYSYLEDENVCLDGSNHKGGCIGDSGGPLLVYHNQKQQVAGVESFISSRGCEAGYPTVFSRVSSYRDWVKSHLS